jgi:hypothetical protein
MLLQRLHGARLHTFVEFYSQVLLDEPLGRKVVLVELGPNDVSESRRQCAGNRHGGLRSTQSVASLFMTLANDIRAFYESQSTFVFLLWNAFTHFVARLREPSPLHPHP